MALSILVIEDTLGWQEQFGLILRDEGYIVEIVGDLIEALARLRQADFDMLIVDLRLSDSVATDLSGMDLLNDAYERQIPAVIVTGYGTPELAKEAFRDYGVYDFMSKDNFDADHFRVRIKNAIATHQAQQQPKPLTPEQKKTFDKTIRKIFRGEEIKLKQ
jgi:DNA-binding NtrC family response regulator